MDDQPENNLSESLPTQPPLSPTAEVIKPVAHAENPLVVSFKNAVIKEHSRRYRTTPVSEEKYKGRTTPTNAEPNFDPDDTSSPFDMVSWERNAGLIEDFQKKKKEQSEKSANDFNEEKCCQNTEAVEATSMITSQSLSSPKQDDTTQEISTESTHLLEKIPLFSDKDMEELKKKVAIVQEPYKIFSSPTTDHMVLEKENNDMQSMEIDDSTTAVSSPSQLIIIGKAITSPVNVAVAVAEEQRPVIASPVNDDVAVAKKQPDNVSEDIISSPIDDDVVAVRSEEDDASTTQAADNVVAEKNEKSVSESLILTSPPIERNPV